MFPSVLRLALHRGARSLSSPWAHARALSTLPDHKLIHMPALSPTMAVGTIQEWKKKEGDSIEGGDVIAEIETDKATRSYEYNDDGFIAKIFIDEGEPDVPVGKLMAIIVEEEEHIPAFKDYVPSEEETAAQPDEAPPTPPAPPTPSAAPTPPPPTPTPAPATAPATATASTPLRSLASPLARVTAANAGVALANVVGTGPGGRVLAVDVEEALASGPQIVQAAPQPDVGVVGMPMYTDVEVSKYRRVAAERLLLSKQTVPHYYLTVDCEVDTMLAMRENINARAKDGDYRLSVNDFVIKAAAAALRKVPEVNAQWMGDKIRMFHGADISIAVQTDQGLITPIVKNADRKGLKEISSDVKELAGKAKDNALAPEEFMGGTFTISNLGMFGVNSFSAIVNPPQAAILAVGTLEKKVVPDDAAEGGFGVRSSLNVTLSCDHRVVDGAVGATWLQEFKKCVEDPINILV